MNTIPEQHKHASPQTVCCAVITVSDTRTLETDSGGQMVVDLLTSAKHTVAVREIIADEPDQMRPLIQTLRDRPDIDAILMTGGTGITSRDWTYETVTAMLDKPLPGYGELFRQLSYEEIGPAAILSRTTGGLCGQTLLLTMPGSPAAVRLAMQKIILPELSHLIGQARQ